MAGSYRYLAADLLTGAIREEVPFRSANYGDVLLGPGSFTASVPLSLKRTVTSSKSYSTTVRADSPVGYWRLSEASGSTAADASGNGRSGTYNGTVTKAAPGLLVGDTNRAATFAGAGSVDVADNAAWSASTTGSLTIEALFTVGSLAATQVVVSKAGAGSTQEWVMRITTAGRLQLLVTSAGGTSLALAQSAAGALVIGGTYHAVATILNGSLVNLAIGGVQVDSQVPTGSTTDTTSTLSIAAKADGTSKFTGTIDEIAIYATVLGGDRILAHAQSAAGTPEVSTVSYDVVKRSVLDPGRTSIYVERDGVLQWGGILWTAQADDAAYNLTIGCEGFWSYFRKRLIRSQQVYAATDQLAIFRALINYAQGIAGGSINVVVGSETSGITRDRTYNSWERKNLGEACEELASVQGGFDFAITVSYVAGVPTPTLVLSYPKRGTRTAHVLDLGTNIEALGWGIDATKQALLIDALGSGDGPAMLISTAADTSLLSMYPLTEDTVSYKDVTVASTLAGWAGATLAAERLPIETLPTLTVHPDADVSVGTIITGDEVKVSAATSGGFLAILNSYFRVLSWNVDVDDNGKETLTFGVSPTEAIV